MEQLHVLSLIDTADSIKSCKTVMISTGFLLLAEQRKRTGNIKYEKNLTMEGLEQINVELN